MTWIEIVDSAVKIGLGAIISAVAGFLMLFRNQKHEIIKDEALHRRQIAASKKALYVDFLTTSHVLVQKYRDNQCRADGEDYFAYLKLYHELEIVADDPLRICAFHLLDAVNQFIVLRKGEMQDNDLFRAMRELVDNKIGEFQYLAKQDINAF